MDDLGTSKTLDGAPPPTAKIPDSLPLQSSGKRHRRPASDAPPSENPRRRRGRRASTGHAKSPTAEAPISLAAGTSPLEGEADEGPFGVGDLVWGKLKIGSWWPGKVLDPTSEPGAKVKKHGEDQRLMVLFFGEGMVAWYEPSQLRPFKEDFKPMTEQNSSEGFVAAVADALAEVKDAVDSEIACFLRDGHEKRDVGTTYVLRHGEFLELAHDAARNMSSIHKLDATMLRCWAVAFRPWNEPLTEVMEDGVLNDVTGTSVTEKLERECQVPSTGSGPMRRPVMPEELKQRRKERSIAELIGTKEHEINAQNANSDKVDHQQTIITATEAAVSSSRQSRSRRKKGQSCAISTVGNGVEALSKERDGESEKLNPSLWTPNKRKTIDDTGKHSDTKSGGSGVVEETGYSRRQRKMSRYLSPPYTNVGSYAQRSFSFKYESSEMQNESEASQLPPATCLQITGGNEDVSQKKQGISAPLFNPDEVSAHVILSKFLSAAANPLCLKWNQSTNVVMHFFEKFRSAAYAEGSDYGNYKKLLYKSSNEHHIPKVDNLGIHSGKTKSTMKKCERKKVVDTSMELDHSSEPLAYSQIRRISSSKSGSKSSERVERKSSNGPTKVDGKEKETCENLVGGKTVHKRHELGSGGKNCLSVGKGKVVDALCSTTLDGLPVSEANKPSKKRKASDKVNGANDLGLDHKTLSSPQEKDSGKQRKKVRTISKCPVSLVLRFSPGTTLPSKDEIISKHSVYGEVYECHTEVSQDSLCALVVFKRRTDAEKAVKSLYNDGTLVSSVSSYELHTWKEKTNMTSPASRTPLPFIRKSLEKIISKLTGFTPPEKDGSSSNHLRPEVKDDLVCEVERLLKKVNKLITGPSAGT